MNLEDNRIPDTVKTVHLTAVCGTGMGALACMLKDRGFWVTGSDQQVYPPMSDFLAQNGIRVTEGFGARNLAYRPDLVVVGNAVTRENPEAQAIRSLGLNFCSMPQAINHFVAAGKKAIVVTGTHGKTTTASLLAWILKAAGCDPSFVIGGILKNFDSNYHLGAGEHLILEGDEYDTAFFDKGPKFLHYRPAVAILTSVEFDHADIFRDLAHVRSAFDNFIKGISPGSILLAVDDDSVVDGLVAKRACRVQRYGRRRLSDWCLGKVRRTPPWTVFEVQRKGKCYHTFKTRLMGDHNLLNALSAIAVAHCLKIPRETIADGLERFAGVKRRQEIRGVKRDIIVIDDFAHHPTAVRETIRAIKPFCGGGRLIAVFEPRTNSSMRRVFQNVYPDAFGGADLVCIRRPSRLEKILPGERFSSETLVADLNRRHIAAHFFADTDPIIDFLVAQARPQDVILIMSNGGFDNIHERLLEAL